MKLSEFFMVAHVNWTKSCMDMVTSACDDMNEAKQQRKHNWAQSEKQLIRSIADGLEAYRSIWQAAPAYGSKRSRTDDKDESE